MRRIPLVPLKEEEVDLVLLVYRVELAEEKIKWLERQPQQQQQQQLDLKQAQAVTNGTLAQYLMFGAMLLIEVLNLFNVHL